MMTIMTMTTTMTTMTTMTASPPRQSDATEFKRVAAGVHFVHTNGASAEKFMPETMGSGVLIFDFDGDDWPDILFINGGSFVDADVSDSAGHVLYRNIGAESGQMTFTGVPGAAGIDKAGYGMGACAGDTDNDGWEDVYITGVGESALYRNAGGVFENVTAASGLGAGVWSTSCAFADIDNDGDLDLYVANYVDFTRENNKYCGNVDNVRFYCHPNIYNGVGDLLYRNDGDGTFTEIGRESGVSTEDGKGLGVVALDYDGDGLVDFYVANDSVPNFLFRNIDGSRFEEVALRAGVSVGSDGQPLAGMGTDAGDVDGDGIEDLVVTNLDRQTHNFYRNRGRGWFSDATYESGIGEATLPYVGFGAVLFDYDNDGDLDLAIANGDVLDNIELIRENARYAQENLLLTNDGRGRFVRADPGPDFLVPNVSRGLVTGDMDRDGDLDLVVSNNGRPAEIFENVGGNQNRSLAVRLRGAESNRSGIGARLTLSVGDRRFVRQGRAGSSYLGQNERQIHFGLGRAMRAERLEVGWPSGIVDVIEAIDAGQTILIHEGRGVVEAEPFPGRR
jgi:hypothetical protein